MIKRLLEKGIKFVKQNQLLLILLFIQILFPEILGGIGFLLIGAIAKDSTTSFNLSTVATGATLASHSASGSNRLVVVTISKLVGLSHTDTTAVSYGGNAMTRGAGVTVSDVQIGKVNADVWYLINPPTGSQNVVITRGSGGAGKTHRGNVTSYTGVKQTGQPDTSGTGDDVDSINLTTTADDCLLVGHFATTQNNPVGTSGQTVNSSASGNDPRYTSVYEIVGTAGTEAMSFSDDGTSDRCIASVAFAPVPVSAPTVTTQAVDDIEKTTATGNGNITATGGADADKRGIVWGDASQSDPGNVAPGSSGYDDFVEATGTFSTGAFDGVIDTLTKGTLYYARAYAHNSEGYSYGAEVSFTAKDDVKIEKSLKYTVVQTPSEITKSLKYVTVSDVAIQKSLKYTIVQTPAQLTKGLIYDVITTPSATQKSLQYAVKPTTTLQLSLKYTIPSSSAIQKGITYTIKQTPSAITKGLIYDVITNTNIQKSLQYEVIQWYQPAIITETVGSIVSGILSDIYEQNDNYLILAEEQTVNPAFVYDFDFYGLPDVGGDHYDAHFHAKYDGSPSHRVKLQQYNFDTLAWENVTSNSSDFPYNADIQTYTYHLLDGADYYDNGHIRLRLNHSQGLGVDTHTMVIDQFVLHTHASLTRTLKYTIESPMVVQKSLKYTIDQTATPLTKSLEYRVAVETLIQKSLHYEVTSGVAVQKVIKYTVVAPATPIEKSIKYTVVAPATPITKSLEYQINPVYTIEKTLKYTVISEVPAITKGLIYDIKTEDVIQKSICYVVTDKNTITKGLIYSVMIENAITKSLKYSVVPSTTITKALQYEIKSEVGITKSIVYSIRSFPYDYQSKRGYDPFH